MMLVIFSLLLIIAITQTIMLLASLISMKSNKDREKSSPFECGFSPFNSSRIPFSLRFFLIAVIFLIFDVEITLLLPIPMIMKITTTWQMSYTLILFLVILTLGLYYEWKKGALEWASFTYI